MSFSLIRVFGGAASSGSNGGVRIAASLGQGAHRRSLNTVSNTSCIRLNHRPWRAYSTEAALPKPKRSKKTRRILIFGLAFSGIIYYLSSSSSSNKGNLNDTTFVPYQITSRIPLSASSFVLTIVPHTPDPSPPYLLPSSHRWRHPLWSVEFKQPEVQISRHYTPLPPSSSSQPSDAEDHEDGPRNGTLQFYIRAVGDGEMSNYLHRLRVGQDVFLRGPHVGLDLVNRLGASKSIVFLAGGTGIVPGLQAAQVALEGYEDTKITLLWAVRKREEIQFVQQQQQPASSAASQGSWWNFWSSPSREPSEFDVQLEHPSPVARQLADMKVKYGPRIDVQVVVDEENTRFDQQHVRKVLTAISDGQQASNSPTGQNCFLHNQRLHERASDFEPESPPCNCAPVDGALPGKNLLIVSGPDGFVSHYAGPKVWQGGQHTQGPLGGVAAQIQRLEPQLASDWLVLKL